MDFHRLKTFHSWEYILFWNIFYFKKSYFEKVLNRNPDIANYS